MSRKTDTLDATLNPICIHLLQFFDEAHEHVEGPPPGAVHGKLNHYWNKSLVEPRRSHDRFLQDKHS